MKGTILANASTIAHLHTRIHDTFAVRSRSMEDRQAWERACAEFHQQYDTLAFPGGLGRALEKLQEGDMITSETAICFLEAHPYFFRSQYIATKLVRL